LSRKWMRPWGVCVVMDRSSAHRRRRHGPVSAAFGFFRTERAFAPVAALGGAVGQHAPRRQITIPWQGHKIVSMAGCRLSDAAPPHIWSNVSSPGPETSLSTRPWKGFLKPGMCIHEVTSPPPQMMRVWGKRFLMNPIMANAHRAWLMKLMDRPTRSGTFSAKRASSLAEKIGKNGLASKGFGRLQEIAAADRRQRGRRVVGKRHRGAGRLARHLEHPVEIHHGPFVAVPDSHRGPAHAGPSDWHSRCFTARRVQVSSATREALQQVQNPVQTGIDTRQSTPPARNAPASRAIPAGGSQGLAIGGWIRKIDGLGVKTIILIGLQWSLIIPFGMDWSPYQLGPAWDHAG
jgi:hypothetical protein